ncbi:MAG TPA: cache domain-containing protein [Sulfuricella sp.]|nr:cache domain-containing protein [Sulfuricella sp.]
MKSIAFKLRLANLLPLVILVVLAILIVAGKKTDLLQERKLKTRHLVETAYGVLNYYQQQEKQGKLTGDAARKAAVEEIKTLRYAGEEYFWINDLGAPVPKMVMHPTVPSLDGKVLDSAKFNCATSMQEGTDGRVETTDGKMNLFVAFDTVANKAGHGYVTYLWPKPKQGGGVTEEIFPKMSYVKKFAPWGWVIGSGIYIDDIDALYWKMVWSFAFIVLLLGAALYAISTIIARSIAQPIADAARVMGEIEVSGDLRRRLPETGGLEAVGIARAFNKLVVDQFEKTEAILTRLQTAKDAVDKANEEQAAIFESSTFGIAFIKDRVVVRANRKLEELLGYDPGELCGQPTRCWYPDEESYRAVGEAYRDLVHGNTHQRVMKMQHKDGSLFWARLSGCALSIDPTHGSVWTVEDVTTEYEATEAMLRAKEMAEDAEGKLRDSYTELEEANRRLQKLDQLKSDFLSSVSHELRTPLTSIRGFAHLVEREFSRSFAPQAFDDAGLNKKSERIRENLAIILKESDRLTRLINDVLDLAKIEAGRVEWRDAPVQPGVLVHDAVNAAQGMFDLKPGVELKVEIEDGLPLFVGDADRMLQVLVNLLNNAAKFTDRGAVTVQVFLNPENLIQIDISDSGIGFPPEEAETIFDKFQQAKHGDTLMDRPAGTGLGLAISREIVERHGGRIQAQSQPGKGSVFSVLLPATDSLANAADISSHIAPSAAEEQYEARPSGMGGKPRVLVVDDDVGVRDYLTQLLQEQGYDVISAADGQAAMGAAQAHRPDLITMDLAMPVMDGRTAIARLRSDPELQHIPIMVVSAFSGWETAGGDLAMGKPLDESRFLKNIHLLLGDGESAELKKVRFLMLYDVERNSAMAPGGFTAHCEVDFCSIDELSIRIRSGFQGMLLIPTDLLNKVDLSMLNAIPSLEVMIMPVPAARETRTEMAMNDRITIGGHDE